MPYINLQKLERAIKNVDEVKATLQTTIYCENCRKDVIAWRPSYTVRFLHEITTSACIHCGFYYPVRYNKKINKKLRLKVYESDNHECAYCGSTSDLSLDHLTPYSKGGKDTFDNLVTCCRPCNSRKRANFTHLPFRYGRFRG